MKTVLIMAQGRISQGGRHSLVRMLIWERNNSECADGAMVNKNKERRQRSTSMRYNRKRKA